VGGTAVGQRSDGGLVSKKIKRESVRLTHLKGKTRELT